MGALDVKTPFGGTIFCGEAVEDEDDDSAFCGAEMEKAGAAIVADGRSDDL